MPPARTHHERVRLPGLDLAITRHVPVLGERDPSRDVVVLVHGFPDCSLGWRRVARRLCERTGFEVIVPDMRGYGTTRVTSREADADEGYCFERSCDDLVNLLDALGVAEAVFVGHDFGGSVVWSLALHAELPGSRYAKRVRAVGSFCTPFFAPNPKSNPWPKMQANPGRFEYQLYFQTQAAVDEYEANIERTVRCLSLIHI